MTKPNQFVAFWQQSWSLFVQISVLQVFRLHCLSDSPPVPAQQVNRLSPGVKVQLAVCLLLYYIYNSLWHVLFSIWMIWIIFAAMSIQLKLSFDGAYQLVFMFIHKTLNILQGWYLQNSLRGVTSDMHEPNFVWLLLSQKTPGLTFLKEDTAILAHKNILNHTHQAWNTSILIAMHG